MRTAYPCLAPIIQKLHRNEKPPARTPDEPDKLNTPAITVTALPDKARFLKHLRHVTQAELQPLWPPLADVPDSLRADAHCSLDAHEPSRQAELRRNEPRNLIAISVGNNGESRVHRPRRI
ncbi:MAG: hypothetical protein V3U98_03630 [Acidobacteriota bacterium]